MSKRIVIDPITRIEGHLRIDVEVERRHGAATPGPRARCGAASRTSCMGRDPREAWLFTQRFCGVCTTVHAIASVRAVENALGLEIPLNAQYIRNLILIAHALHDHIVHFYHLSALDWVDVVVGAQGRPGEDVGARREPLALAAATARRRSQAIKDEARGASSSAGQLGHLRQRLLGPPGDEAAARR